MHFSVIKRSLIYITVVFSSFLLVQTFLQREVLLSSGAKKQVTPSPKSIRNIKKTALRPMLPLMDIVRNINIVTILIVQFIMTHPVNYIFISKGITGKLEHLCQATFG